MTHLGRAPAPPDPWRDAALAAALVAVDPSGTGACLRARPGPLRDRWLTLLRALLPPAAPFRRVPSGVPDGRLLGGLDLAATLRAGAPVAERGVLAEADGGVVVLAMAERLEPGTAARIGAVLDQHAVALQRDGLAATLPARIGAVALDEGLEPDERPPAALRERLAFLLDADAIPRPDPDTRLPGAEDVAAARNLLPHVVADDSAIGALCTTAAALGVPSLRAPVMALRAARASAALAGRRAVTAEDVALAARLVLAPRATMLPVAPEDSPAPPAPPAPGTDDAAAGDDAATRDRALEDRVLEAAAAAIPPGLLATLQPGAARRSGAAGRAGALRKAGGRGRPVGVRRGAPGRGARLDVVETLRAAAPWQKLRPSSGAALVQVRPDDFRVVRVRQRTETTAIFAVDASGSAALHRLAEAKGAVCLMLADCYTRRDHVAVVGFRGSGAELLLPPTGSLVRARRCLNALPGGGGTPLASGIAASAALAEAEQRRGRTPLLVLLTDGQANIARDGTPGRPGAHADALAAARAARACGFAALFVDTAPRPQPRAQEIAASLGARYLPLPKADPAALSRAVQAATRAATSPATGAATRAPIAAALP